MSKLFLVAVLATAISLPSAAEGQQAAAGAARALSQGLSDLADDIRADRARREALEVERMRAESDRELNAALAELARSQSQQVNAATSAQASASDDRMHRVIDELLFREFETTPRYAQLSEEYFRILDAFGEEVADTFWLGAQAHARGYVLARWAEMFPEP
ncbi:MAG: hypothetical protein WD056_01610 [Gemmatimonadota bacterium]